MGPPATQLITTNRRSETTLAAGENDRATGGDFIAMNRPDAGLKRTAVERDKTGMGG